MSIAQPKDRKVHSMARDKVRKILHVHWHISISGEAQFGEKIGKFRQALNRKIFECNGMARTFTSGFLDFTLNMKKNN